MKSPPRVLARHSRIRHLTWVPVCIIALTVAGALYLSRPRDGLSKEVVEASLKIGMTPSEVEGALKLRPGSMKLVDGYQELDKVWQRTTEPTHFEAEFSEEAGTPLVPGHNIYLHFNRDKRLIAGYGEQLLSADDINYNLELRQR
jgi:hypothetical protein